MHEIVCFFVLLLSLKLDDQALRNDVCETVSGHGRIMVGIVPILSSGSKAFLCHRSVRVVFVFCKCRLLIALFWLAPWFQTYFFPSFAAFISKSLFKNALKSQFWSLGVKIRFLEVGFCACGAYCYCVLQALLSNRLIVLARRCSCGTVRCVL